MSAPAATARRTLTVRRPLVRPAGKRNRLLGRMRGWVVRGVIVLGATLVFLCMLDVWLRLQVTHLGYELSVARKMQLRLEHERGELELELATLRDPARIDLGARRLGMTEPRKGQVVTLR